MALHFKKQSATTVYWLESKRREKTICVTVCGKSLFKASNTGLNTEALFHNLYCCQLWRNWSKKVGHYWHSRSLLQGPILCLNVIHLYVVTCQIWAKITSAKSNFTSKILVLLLDLRDSVQFEYRPELRPVILKTALTADRAMSMSCNVTGGKSVKTKHLNYCKTGLHCSLCTYSKWHHIAKAKNILEILKYWVTPLCVGHSRPTGPPFWDVKTAVNKIKSKPLSSA